MWCPQIYQTMGFLFILFYVLWFDASKKLNYFSSFEFVIQLIVVFVFLGNGRSMWENLTKLAIVG